MPTKPTLILLALLSGAVAFPPRGQTADNVPPPAAVWPPKIYGFCFEIHDARKRSLAEQVEMVKELGFDGVGYPLWLDSTLDDNLRTIDQAGLELCLVYASVNVNPTNRPYDPRLPEAIRKLNGRGTCVALLLTGLPPGDPRGEEPAVRILRELGDVAGEVGVRISIYHHTGDWSESFLQAMRLVEQLGHQRVGANFNLCHWLKVEGGRDYEPVLRQHAGRIFAVTINGAQPGAATWTNGLIQPLGQGDFDNRRLLATLRQIGYRGPIGLMCYGIPGDARIHLRQSLEVWNSWK